jgi:AbiV family abortive infection protein
LGNRLLDFWGMGKRKLDSYQGRLSAAQIAAGMNAAAKNARRLAEDAVTLLELERFPTATSLAILSIEEVGKISILRELALAKSRAEIATAWRSYRSHTHKNVQWLLPQLIVEGARKLEDFRPLFDKASDHPLLLDQLKQIGFYSDCLGRAHWAIPSDVIDEKLARTFVQVAQMFVRHDRDYTEKEIELWIEHLRPVWKRDLALMEKALVSWYAAMQAEGLAPADGPNEMEQFVYYGLKKPN